MRYVILLTLLVAALAGGCAEIGDTKSQDVWTRRPMGDRWTVVLDEQYNGQTVPLKGATGVLIRLDGNPTTGYMWKLDHVDGASLEQVGEIEYLAAPQDNGMVGAGGVYEARFQPKKIGKTTIRMVYVRPWEQKPTTQPAAKTPGSLVKSPETYTVTVDVLEKPCCIPKE